MMPRLGFTSIEHVSLESLKVIYVGEQNEHVDGCCYFLVLLALKLVKP